MKAWEYWLAFPVLCCCHTILWYCTDPWPQGGLSPSSLDWLHQIDATSDSVHARIFFFFNFWGIIAISPSFPCSSGTDGWSVGDRTTHWRLGWVGCWTSPLSWCSQAFHSFQGAQFELGKCSTCSQRCKLPAAPWEHPACFSWKIKSNVSKYVVGKFAAVEFSMILPFQSLFFS